MENCSEKWPCTKTNMFSSAIGDRVELTAAAIAQLDELRSRKVNSREKLSLLRV